MWRTTIKLMRTAKYLYFAVAIKLTLETTNPTGSLACVALQRFKATCSCADFGKYYNTFENEQTCHKLV